MSAPSYADYDAKIGKWWDRVRAIEPSIGPLHSEIENEGGRVYQMDPFGSFDEGVSPEEFVDSVLNG